MSKADLSPSMREAREFAEKNGGELVRHQGGYWSREGWRQGDGVRYFSASTVHALVSRGVAVYSEHVDGRSGRFPVRAKLV